MNARQRRRAHPPSDIAVAERFVHAVAATILTRKLLKGQDHVLLAVSGGADSIALLHVMSRLQQRFELQMHVAHFDHAQRAASAADADFVRQQAEQLELPFSLGKLQQERSSGQSPEDFFRTQRERFLHSVATDIGASRILTGHTRNDQAETVLLNLLFGAGKRGLGGMPPARWRVARPLIDRSREETEAFCTALGITPCQDETNTDPAYRRNEVRLDLMPRLKDMEPRIVEHLAQLADVQRGEDYFLDAAAAQAVPITESDEGTSAMVSDLAAAAEPLRRRAIRLLARNENLGLSFSQCEQIARLVLDGEDGSGLDLGGGLSARRQAGLLTVGRDRQDAASS